jgi:hypothetical protein
VTAIVVEQRVHITRPPGDLFTWLCRPGSFASLQPLVEAVHIDEVTESSVVFRAIELVDLGLGVRARNVLHVVQRHDDPQRRVVSSATRVEAPWWLRWLPEITAHQVLTLDEVDGGTQVTDRFELHGAHPWVRTFVEATANDAHAAMMGRLKAAVEGGPRFT